MDYLRLIRYKNVIFVGVIQALMYWAVICPILEVFGLYSTTPVWVVWGSILSTMLIAGGGYVINDYFDVKIDRINRPDKLIVTKGIQKHEAMRLYQAITAVGLVMGVAVSVYMRSFTMGFVYVVVPGVLWFYSASYKRQLIIGNLIVAAASALVPLMPLILEAKQLDTTYGDLIKETPILRNLYATVCIFAMFAFLFTFIREIVKDLEDEPGDRELECHTIPVVWGDLAAKAIVTVLTALACVAMAWVVFGLVPFEGSATVRYYLFGLVAPCICFLIILWFGGCRAYSNASTMLKFIMVVGVLYSLLYYYLMAEQYGLTMFGLFKLV